MQWSVAIGLLLLVITAGQLQAIAIGSLRDIPAGTIRLSMHEGNTRQSLEISWGGDTADTGSHGAVAQLRSEGSTEPTVAKLSEGALDRLFSAAAKLAADYPVPRSKTGNRSNRNMFQLYIGLRSDPVRMSFPANETDLWNRAATCWMLFAGILKQEASLSLPVAKPIAGTGSVSPTTGLVSIVDFTSLELTVERVHRNKSDYGTISAKWGRSEDGTITFTAKYDSRDGSSISGSPTPAQIRPIFEAVQKLVKGYRHPSFERSKKSALSRSYDSINLGISPTDQPGECLLPFFSTDSSQWSNADRLWSLLLEVFPKDERGKILQ